MNCCVDLASRKGKYHVPFNKWVTSDSCMMMVPILGKCLSYKLFFFPRILAQLTTIAIVVVLSSKWWSNLTVVWIVFHLGVWSFSFSVYIQDNGIKLGCNLPFLTSSMESSTTRKFHCSWVSAYHAFILNGN